MGKIDAKGIVRDIEKAVKSETKKLNFFVRTVADLVDNVVKEYGDEYDAVYSGVKNKLKRFFSSKRKGDLKSYLKSVEEDIGNIGTLLRGVGRIRAKDEITDDVDKILGLLETRLNIASKNFAAVHKKAGGKSAKKAFDADEIAGKSGLKPTKNTKYGAAFASEDYDKVGVLSMVWEILEPLQKPWETLKEANRDLRIACGGLYDYLKDYTNFYSDKGVGGMFDSLLHRYADCSGETVVVKNIEALRKDVVSSHVGIEKKFSEYSAEIKKRSDFAKMLKKCYVFDTNMGGKATVNVSNGTITADPSYKEKTLVKKAPTCYSVALSGKLEQQYDHKQDSFWTTCGPYYTIIDVKGNPVKEAKGEENRGNSVNTVGSDCSEASAKKAIEQVIKVLQDSLKAGEWVPIK